MDASNPAHKMQPTHHNEPEMQPTACPDLDTDTVANEKAKAAAKEAEEDMEYPHGIKLIIILAALCLAVFLVALDQTIITTAIPKITDHFNSIKDIVSISKNQVAAGRR